MPPYLAICPKSPEEIAASLIICDIKNGIKHSQNASKSINMGVMIDGFLYCLTLPSSVFTVLAITQYSLKYLPLSL